MRTKPPAVLPLLRSRVQGDLLALLYLHPDVEYSISRAAAEIGASINATHKEATRLIDAGLVLSRRQGSLRLVKAALDTPLAGPLADLLAVTHGPLPVLRDILAEVSGVEEAYIYGSWAARYQGDTGPPPADVDVLVVGTPELDTLDDATEEAQRRLRRPVSVRRIRRAAWTGEGADPFLQSVRARPMVRLLPYRSGKVQTDSTSEASAEEQ